MQDSSFVGVETAATGLGGTTLCSFGGDLCLDFVLFASLLADGVGGALSFLVGGVLLKRRKFGVMFRCFTFY